MTYWTADTHYNHKNIMTYCNRDFGNTNKMNQHLITCHNKVVKPQDTLIHLGDVYMSNKTNAMKALRKLNGRKILVLGNHDNLPLSEWKEVFDEVYSWYIIEHQNYYVVMAHDPIETIAINSNLGFDKPVIMLNGHIHDTALSTPDGHGNFSINVGVDVNDYYPMSFNQILDRRDAVRA